MKIDEKKIKYGLSPSKIIKESDLKFYKLQEYLALLQAFKDISNVNS